MKSDRFIPVKFNAHFFLYMLCAITTFYLLPSCHKAIMRDENPPVPRRTFLIGNVWGAPTMNSISSLSTGTPVSYKGTAADSIIFNWTINPNVYIYGINSFIGGKNVQHNINRIGQCSFTTALGNDTTTIAFDTIMLGSPWKQGYSDTLFVTKTSPTQLVFTVRYSLPSGSGVEIDTFHTVRIF